MLSSKRNGKIIKLNDINSWNASILLLQTNLDIGWKLYDFGLRSPAKGAHMAEGSSCFHPSRNTFVESSSLDGKSLLLLEEQAIDAMQFSHLYPQC